MPVGLSKVARQKEKLWTKKTKRPQGWHGAVYGLVTHTSGSGLPSNAKKAGQKVIDRALSYYSRSHGCHYVCGWHEADLWQIANEIESANGVGVTAIPTKDQKGQVESVAGKYSGSWETDLTPAFVTRWKTRWAHLEDVKTPLDLFPTKYANSCYVHVEMPPCVFHHNGKLVTGAEPMEEGLWFTKAQHDNIVKLAMDIAERNGWPNGWWSTGRFVTHEDITPISRSNRYGGWDPGVLRSTPRFDWDYVVSEIERLTIEQRKQELVIETNKKIDEAIPLDDVGRVGTVVTYPGVKEDDMILKKDENGVVTIQPYHFPEPTFWRKLVEFVRKLFNAKR